MNNSNDNQYIQRDVYRDILEWDNKYELNGRMALFVNGARQVGKTYLLKKFANERYRGKYIYIDINADKEFNQLLEKYMVIGGIGSDENKYRDWFVGLFKEYAKLVGVEYENDSSYIIIIDEIQEDVRIFNRIRMMRRCLNNKLIVTGSYLGVTIMFGSNKYFTPVGDVISIDINTLSYKEFICAIGGNNVYNGIIRKGYDNNNETDKENFERLKTAYDVYTTIGGYPEAINTFIRYRLSKFSIEESIEAAEREVESIIKQFVNDSMKYIDTEIEKDGLMETIVKTSVNIISGSGRLKKAEYKESKRILLDKEYNQDVNEKQKKSCIAWLLMCGLLKECSIDRGVGETGGCKYFFADLGVLRYMANKGVLIKSNNEGYIAENFVYNYLQGDFMSIYKDIRKRCYISSFENSGQVDFIIYFGDDDISIAVEVKSGRGDVISSKKMLRSGVVDYIIKVTENNGIVHKGEKLITQALRSIHELPYKIQELTGINY